MSLSAVVTLHKTLKAEFSRGNFTKCGQLLDDLKVKYFSIVKFQLKLQGNLCEMQIFQIHLIKISYIPTSNTATKDELVVARDVLEIGAEHSVATKNIAAFERYMSQLKCYYYDYK